MNISIFTPEEKKIKKHRKNRFYPAAITLRLMTTIVIAFVLTHVKAGEIETVSALVDENRVLSDAVELHITSATDPLQNSTIKLSNEDAWVVFENIRPSDVLANYQSQILIGDEALNPGVNGRVAIYAHGTAIMPHNAAYTPLQVFTDINFTGSDSSFVIHTFHNTLNRFNNAMQSFKLKKGYQATFANNSDGTGYSRVYIAADNDLEISELPAELSQKISFIRVFKHQYTTKKGWCGVGSGAMNDADKTHSTWYYTWSADQYSTNNLEYAVIRQKAWWPGWGEINNKENVSQLLGYNEPDRPDQADLSVDFAISQWPNFMKSGLRVGSPATSDPFNGWLFDFMDKADELNYRIDYVVIHAYWAKSATQWYNDLKYVHEKTGRPIWITEWNNGANWTNEWWPAAWEDQQQKQLNDLTAILNVLDTTSFVERYSIYNWVTEKRAIILADTLTPAGEYYTNNNSVISYKTKNVVVPTWNALGATLELSNSGSKIRLIWTDPNYELTTKYSIDRKISDGNFEEIYSTEDISTQSYTDILNDTISGNINYRVRATVVNGTSATSNTMAIYKTSGKNNLQLENFSLYNFDWKTAIFSYSYAETPVAILGSSSYNNRTIETTQRIKSLTTNSLLFHTEPWSYEDSLVAEEPEMLSLLTLPSGNYTFGKLSAEAGNVSGVKTEWKQVTFSEPFDVTPVVFSTQITSNPNFPTTPVVRNVSTTGFEISLLKEEEVETSSWGDKVSYFAITPGIGVADNKRVEVGLTAENEVGGYYVHKEVEIIDSTQPALFAALQTTNDDITSTLRYYVSNQNTFRIFKVREKSKSSAPVAKDQVGYMTIGFEFFEQKETTSSLAKIGTSNLIYPNPTSGMLFFNMEKQAKVEIFDLTGTKVLEDFVTNEMNIESLPSGLYLIKINGDIKTKISKQ